MGFYPNPSSKGHFRTSRHYFPSFALHILDLTFDSILFCFTVSFFHCLGGFLSLGLRAIIRPSSMMTLMNEWLSNLAARYICLHLPIEIKAYQCPVPNPDFLAAGPEYCCIFGGDLRALPGLRKDSVHEARPLPSVPATVGICRVSRGEHTSHITLMSLVSTFLSRGSGGVSISSRWNNHLAMA